MKIIAILGVILLNLTPLFMAAAAVEFGEESPPPDEVRRLRNEKERFLRILGSHTKKPLPPAMADLLDTAYANYNIPGVKMVVDFVEQNQQKVRADQWRPTLVASRLIQAVNSAAWLGMHAQHRHFGGREKALEALRNGAVIPPPSLDLLRQELDNVPRRIQKALGKQNFKFPGMEL
jgi:hypothetical protein